VPAEAEGFAVDWSLDTGDGETSWLTGALGETASGELTPAKGYDTPLKLGIADSRELGLARTCV
jgi:hypothetical protein